MPLDAAYAFKHTCWLAHLVILPEIAFKHTAGKRGGLDVPLFFLELIEVL
jgi:hypothetical protein